MGCVFIVLLNNNKDILETQEIAIKELDAKTAWDNIVLADNNLRLVQKVDSFLRRLDEDIMGC